MKPQKQQLIQFPFCAEIRHADEKQLMEEQNYFSFKDYKLPILGESHGKKSKEL